MSDADEMTPVIFDPRHEAFVHGGPESGRRVKWQGVPVVHVPALPPVLGIMPTWNELNVPMCYHKYVRFIPTRVGNVPGSDPSK